jgi:hypothetical protein
LAILISGGNKSKIQTILLCVCVFLNRFPPFRRKTGVVAMRQQVLIVNQQIAESGQ